MIYELRLLATESATGYFGCIPKTDLHYEGCQAYARRHPNDEFMRRHLLRLIQQREESELKEIVAGIDPDDRFLRALLWEACQARPGRWKSRGSFSPKELNALTAQTPLLDLKAHLLRDRGLHRKWIALFRANICEHRPLPDPAAMGWSGPFSDARVKNLLEPRVTLKQLGEAPRPLAAEAGPPELGPEQVHALALERLRQAPASLERVVSGTSTVFHLAGRIALVEDRAVDTMRVNVIGTRHVVDACLASGVGRLVHVSSIHALSDPGGGAVVDENSALANDPRLPAYDRSKAAGQGVVSAGVSRGLDAVIVQPSACIRPWDFKPSAMGRVLLDLANRRLPALVRSGYHWTDTRDLAGALIAAARRGRRGASYLVAGPWRSVGDIARIVAGRPAGRGDHVVPGRSCL